MEFWKQIDTAPYFEVSNQGRVRHSKFKRIRAFYFRNDYANVSLRTDGKTRRYFVHRLVADAFLPKPDHVGPLYIDHLNRLRNDNRVSNLQWISKSENVRKRRAYVSLDTIRAISISVLDGKSQEQIYKDMNV